MAQVGTIQCDFVHGVASGKLKRRVDVFRVPGLDGLGAQDLGKSESAASFEAVKYGDQATVDTWIGQIEDLQGTILTIIDDYATSNSNMLLRLASSPQRVVALKEGGIRGSIRIEGLKVI